MATQNGDRLYRMAVALGLCVGGVLADGTATHAQDDKTSDNKDMSTAIEQLGKSPQLATDVIARLRLIGDIKRLEERINELERLRKEGKDFFPDDAATLETLKEQHFWKLSDLKPSQNAEVPRKPAGMMGRVPELIVPIKLKLDETSQTKSGNPISSTQGNGGATSKTTGDSPSVKQQSSGTPVKTDAAATGATPTIQRIIENAKLAESLPSLDYGILSPNQRLRILDTLKMKTGNAPAKSGENSAGSIATKQSSSNSAKKDSPTAATSTTEGNDTSGKLTDLPKYFVGGGLSQRLNGVYGIDNSFRPLGPYDFYGYRIGQPQSTPRSKFWSSAITGANTKWVDLPSISINDGAADAEADRQAKQAALRELEKRKWVQLDLLASSSRSLAKYQQDKADAERRQREVASRRKSEQERQAAWRREQAEQQAAWQRQQAEWQRQQELRSSWMYEDDYDYDHSAALKAMTHQLIGNAWGNMGWTYRIPSGSVGDHAYP